MTTLESAFSRAVELIDEADGLIIAAGAGMGVDSGLPDFRGNDGFWNAYPALRDAGVDFYQAANPTSFRAHPERAWGFYGHRLALYRKATPHPGFDILKRWGDAKPHGYRVFTSNVDGQFQKAGYPPDWVVECHGSLHQLQCQRPCHQSTWSAEGFEPSVDIKQCLLTSPLPLCPQCGRMARPNLLMFGDYVWLADSYEAREHALVDWMGTLERPVVIEMGAGTAVPSVRRFSESAPGVLIRVNPREPKAPWSDSIELSCSALNALETIDALLSR